MSYLRIFYLTIRNRLNEVFWLWVGRLLSFLYRNTGLLAMWGRRVEMAPHRPEDAVIVKPMFLSKRSWLPSILLARVRKHGVYDLNTDTRVFVLRGWYTDRLLSAKAEVCQLLWQLDRIYAADNRRLFRYNGAYYRCNRQGDSYKIAAGDTLVIADKASEGAVALFLCWGKCRACMKIGREVLIAVDLLEKVAAK